MRAWLQSIPVPERALRELDTADLPAAPWELYVAWLQDAVAAGEVMPQALNLATSDPEDGVTARTVMLRDLFGDTWCFATSSQSPKARQLRADSRAALTALWARLGRQVRVTGTVTDLGDGAGATDFHARSRGSQAAVLVGNQSRPLGSRAHYRRAIERAKCDLTEQQAAPPVRWRVFGLHGQAVDFWQETPDHEQVRVQYRHHDFGWTKEMLWP